MRLKSALRRGVAAAVIAGIVVSSGIPAYAKTWNIADGDITVKGASDESGNYNEVKQGNKDFEKDTDTVITSKSDKSEESKEHTVTIDTSEGNVDVTFDDLKIDVSGKKEGDGSGDSPVDAGKAAVTVQGDHDATIELDGKNELKSGSYNAGLEKNGHESSGKLTIKDDKGKDGSLIAEGGFGGAGIGEERDGIGLSGRGSEEAQLFGMLDNLPLAGVTTVLVMLLVAVFFVSGADAASMVMGTLSPLMVRVPSTSMLGNEYWWLSMFPRNFSRPSPPL